MRGSASRSIKRIQFPYSISLLSWVSTVHKFQGLSSEQVEMICKSKKS